MNRRTVIGWATAAVVFGLSSVAGAEEPPIKIGMSMPQTGGLAGGGKASLLGIEIWRDDVNAKGGLLGRKVELVVYDDKSSASETPALYAKLLDVDKVDLLFAPYGTVPTAPIMPLVKQRGRLLMGNFSFQVTEAIAIEDGRLTHPVRNATLAGNGNDAMLKIDAVGNDLTIDGTTGSCGKDGQWKPCGVGQPTVRFTAINVGGTAA